jgi:hypothetical protein
VSAFLCKFLDDHGVKPVKVLKKAGLRQEPQADWHNCDAVHALYMATWPLSSCPKHFILIVRLPLLLTSSLLSLILTQTLTLVRPAFLSFSLVGSVQGLFSCFSLSLRYSSGFTRGGLVTHNLSSLPGLAFFCIQSQTQCTSARAPPVSSRHT